ncbi:MAG: hypothetical protein II968_07215 [Selenomonadaceae bacterium]|nr:hypothetical protein [Selenomonadaceae bacterium]
MFMKKVFTLATLLLCLLTATTSFAASVAEQRAQINELHDKTLAKLYEKYPHARRVINECYAYATLSSTGIKLGLFGDAHGRGIAINNQTGERVYLRMKELSAGLGLGVKEYDLIFLLNTREAWDNFIIGKIRFGASAEASADDGVSGGTIEGATYVAPGVWLFQMTTKGLALDATLKGTKIYKDKKLNQY